MPSITQLKYILAVHRHGHFGQAAKACHVSQPTLSTQIRKAEEELGIALFQRQNKPVSVTERGAAVIEQAQVVVAAHERLVRLAQGKFEQRAGAVRLGIIPTLAPYVLPWFVQGFAKAHPLVQLTIEERTTEEILRGLKRQTLDVGLLAIPLHEPRLVERPLFVDPFYLYAAEGEPLLDHDEVEVTALDPDRMWLLEEGHCVRHQTLALCNRDTRQRHLATVTFEAGSFDTLRNLIDAAEGYTIVPETYAQRLGRDVRKKQVRAFSGPTPAREVGLVHLRNTWKTDLLDALEESIKAALPRPFRRTPAEPMVLPVRDEG